MPNTVQRKGRFLEPARCPHPRMAIKEVQTETRTIDFIGNRVDPNTDTTFWGSGTIRYRVECTGCGIHLYTPESAPAWLKRYIAVMKDIENEENLGHRDEDDPHLIAS